MSRDSVSTVCKIFCQYNGQYSVYYGTVPVQCSATLCVHFKSSLVGPGAPRTPRKALMCNLSVGNTVKCNKVHDTIHGRPLYQH